MKRVISFMRIPDIKKIKNSVGVIIPAIALLAAFSAFVMRADVATAQTPNYPTFQYKMPKSVKITTDKKCNVEVEYNASPYRTPQNTGVKRIVAVLDISYLNLSEDELPPWLKLEALKATFQTALEERYLPFITPTRDGCPKPEVIIHSTAMTDDIRNKILSKETATMIFRIRPYLRAEKPIITMYRKFFRPGMSPEDAWKYDYYWSEVMSFSLVEADSELKRRVSAFISRGMRGPSSLEPYP